MFDLVKEINVGSYKKCFTILSVLIVLFARPVLAKPINIFTSYDLNNEIMFNELNEEELSDIEGDGWRTVEDPNFNGGDGPTPIDMGGSIGIDPNSKPNSNNSSTSSANSNGGWTDCGASLPKK